MTRDHTAALRPLGAMEVGAAGSLLHRLDPRAKIVMVTGTMLVVLSEPPGALAPFRLYAPLILGLLLVARVSPRFLGRRLLAVTPFVMVAALLILLTGAGPNEVAGSLVLRALAAVALLSLLVATEPISRILWGLDAVGLPRVLTTQAAFMLRFAHILGEEAVRTDIARRARTPGPLRAGRLRTLGQQAALVFLRGWRRSHVVHQAMLSRGFTGTFPVPPGRRLLARDVGAVAVVLGAFIAVRCL